MADFENDDYDKPMNMTDEQAKNNLYDENMDNGNEPLGNSKNDLQVSNRYTLVDNNFDEDKSRENSIGANEIKKESNLLNENDFVINDSNANSKRVSRQSNKIGVTFIDLKIILLGDVSVGKTSIIGRYINSSFEDNYKPNVSAEKRLKVINEDDNTSLRLNIWDTAGQEKYRAVTRQFYRDSDGAIIVFDLTKKNTFNGVQNWIKELKTHGSEDTEIIILGNKSDLPNEREISEEDIKNEINNKYKYFEVSAKSGNNISLAFDELKKLMMKKIKNKDNNLINNAPQVKKRKLSKKEKQEAQTLDDIDKKINMKEKKCC